MYLRMPEDIEAELEGLVGKALAGDDADGWKVRTSKLLGDLADQVKEELYSYIGYQLEEDLKIKIAAEARRAAERFLGHLAEGDEKAIQEFIGDPPGYNGWQRKREEWTWLPFGQQHGPVALRRKMVDFVRDHLIDERVKDLEVEAEVLREGIRKREDELRQWRTGERTYRSTYG